MESYWNEVVVVKKENRHELSLQGSEISSRISKSGLCPGIFTLTGLNHLEISSTCLSNVNVGNLGNLVNLSSLILCSNKIEKMPKSLGKLTKLKVLDLSNNELISLPEEISTLISLEVFNINKNLLEEIPSVCGLVKLHKLNLSHNKLKSLPQGISDKKLVHLSHIWASNNEIVEIPDDLLNLPHLNVLDLAENKIKDVPPELSLCLRLKELNLKGNVVPDRKLSKLLEQSSKKSIFEFLSNVLDKKQKSEGSSRGGGGGGGKKNKKKSRFQTKGEGDEVCEEEKLVKNQINVLRFPEENGVSIVVSRAVLNVRPFIVCCFVKNLNFNRNTTAFKKFIALQTKLHDTICEKRQVATIATHDLNLVKYPLSYDAKVPSQIKIIPLFAKEEVTAQTLVANLRKEADEIRKEKKRNKLSGIHKYLDLLHEKPEYPCLVDKDGHVISFPPITNSDKTKISKESSSVLIEITSSRSLNICKEVMDVLLLEMLNLGIGEILPGQNGTESLNEEEEGNVKYKLTIQQVNVLNEDHSLRVVYPSRTDLQNSDLINVTYYDMKD